MQALATDDVCLLADEDPFETGLSGDEGALDSHKGGSAGSDPREPNADLALGGFG